MKQTTISQWSEIYAAERQALTPVPSSLRKGRFWPLFAVFCNSMINPATLVTSGLMLNAGLSVHCNGNSVGVFSRCGAPLCRYFICILPLTLLALWMPAHWLATIWVTVLAFVMFCLLERLSCK
ncbi:hypothetical protein [Parendozoicomonas sp. Alg238-R29]|uniref:hypothetical protein n=1 Tax=Parendozoicomonas sp. Alg238-R29 TaxID=2993446 RepID=UPI00248DAD7A|nr:hypothetical protein [Parendozoicomonas sp. Alg238-R29]